MSATLHCLVDNTPAEPGFLHEHGLSMALTLENGHTWLWDAGSSNKFLANARTMGLNLDKLAGAALSHGHYDHGDGLASLLEQTGFRGDVHAHCAVCLKRYSIKQGAKARHIGLAPDISGRLCRHLALVKETGELDQGLIMAADIPRLPGNLQSVQDFYLDSEGAFPDPVPDDAFLLLRTAKGVSVILGCCHAGLANTLARAADLAGTEEFNVIAGGLHLMDGNAERLAQTVDTLKRYKARAVYAGHCTGEKGLAGLRKELPGFVHPLGAGTVIEL